MGDSPVREALDEIAIVKMRLDAWADSAAITARNLTDSEAAPWRNMKENYEDLAKRLQAAKDRLERLATQ